MALYSKIKYVARVFIKTPGKQKLVVKSLRVLKNEGVSGLKRAIKATEQKNETLVDLYEKQQAQEKDYQEYAETVLYLIYGLSDAVEQSDAYRLISEQKKENDRIVIIKKEDFHSLKDRLQAENISSDYVFMMKEGDYPAPNMRDEFAQAMHEKKYAMIYSDKCIYDNNNGRILRYAVKPDFHAFDLYQYSEDWNAVMFEYAHFLELLETDAQAETFENRMLELVLASVQKTNKVHHIDGVLLFRKDILIERDLTERRFILEKALKNQGIKANVIIANDSLKLCSYGECPMVSLVILAESAERTTQCIDSILDNTGNVNYELLVALDEDMTAEFKDYEKRSAGLKLISCAKELTYTQRCNRASGEAKGELLVFLLDDMKIQEKDWLRELTGVFAFPEIAAASPKILRQDNTIRYAGMLAGGFGFTPLLFNGEGNQYTVNTNEPAFYNREISVLSASCLAVRKGVFDAIGGFDAENFSDKFANAQLSFAVQRAGYGCAYCADVALVSTGTEWYDSWYDKGHPSAYLQLLKNYGEELSDERCFTESMKHLYLRGVPVGFRIYQKKNEIVENKKSVLMVSHDSLLGGATIAFQYAGRALKKAGYNVVWLLEREGAMLEELERDGIGYIVDPSYKGSDVWMNYAENFELIICSTIVLCPQVEKLKNRGKKVIWWVHEAKDYYAPEVTTSFTRENLQNLNVWCGGTFAEKTFKERFAGINTDVVLYGVPDYTGENVAYGEKVIDNPKDKMIFLSIGTIESRKGQDILAEAIGMLAPEVRENCLFVFLGKSVQENVFEKVQNVATEYPESVTLMKPVNRSTLMQMYHQGDAVLCTSREDPMPVFMTECMMQSKIAICSENTGTAGVLTDGKDGFIYHNNSPEELAEKITYVLKHQDEMQQIRVNARETYEKNFAMDVFEKNLQTRVEKILEE